VKRNGRWQASQKVRKRIEEIFGEMKTTGNFRKSRYRGITRTPRGRSIYYHPPQMTKA